MAYDPLADVEAARAIITAKSQFEAPIIDIHMKALKAGHHYTLYHQMKEAGCTDDDWVRLTLVSKGTYEATRLEIE